MSASKVEAMLFEAHINRTDALVLFRHLEQFFGASFFESENKRRALHDGKEFVPTVNVYSLSIDCTHCCPY